MQAAAECAIGLLRRHHCILSTGDDCCQSEGNLKAVLPKVQQHPPCRCHFCSIAHLVPVQASKSALLCNNCHLDQLLPIAKDQIISPDPAAMCHINCPLPDAHSCMAWTLPSLLAL